VRSVSINWSAIASFLLPAWAIRSSSEEPFKTEERRKEK